MKLTVFVELVQSAGIDDLGHCRRKFLGRRFIDNLLRFEDVKKSLIEQRNRYGRILGLRLPAQIVWQQDPDTVEEEDHGFDPIVVMPHRAGIIEGYFLRLDLFGHGNNDTVSFTPEVASFASSIHRSPVLGA